jgi:hypothetical protein
MTNPFQAPDYGEDEDEAYLLEDAEGPASVMPGTRPAAAWPHG